MVYGLSTDPLQALKGLKQKGATTTTSTPNFTTIKGKTETTPTVGLKPKQLAEIGGYAGGFAGITKPTIGTQFGAPAGAEKTAMVNMPQEVQKRIVQDVQNKSALPGTQGLEQKAGIDTTEPQFMETNVEGQITEQSPVQLYADLKAGMPISEASKYYPEYAANLATINQLKADIDAGMPEAMIPQYYPELYPQVAEEQQRGGGVKGAAAAFSPIDLGPTGETLINPVGRVAEIIDNQIQRIGSFDFTKTAEENLDRRVANLTQKELEKYQKEREKYKKDNPGLAKQYTKSVEGNNLLAQMWNIVTGDTKDTDEVEAFKAFVRQREKKFVEELAGADTKGPHMANIIANAPGSALKTVSAIGRAVLNPADTLAGLGKIIFTEEGRKAITDRYGSREAFAKTLETDPIGVASDVLAVVEGGAGIVKTGAKVTSRIAERAGALETAAKAGRVAEKAGEFGKVTGISSDLGLRQLLPYQIGRAVKAVENVPVVGKIAKYGQAMTTPLDMFVSVAKPIAGKVLPTAEETLQRMNRMTAGDQRKFLKENKQTVGQFINKEYGAVSPREAVEKALNTVNENKNQVNQAVEQIQGPQRFEAVEYTDADGNKLKYDGDAISDMADMGIERASNTNSPLKKLFVDFKDKYKAGTATMTDINKIQRTFQANVGMAYFKDIAAGDKKAKATNIDTAVRERKMKKGIDYGFTNFREINRNTKAHMAIVKGLEKRDAGRAGNNAVSLTDWIMFAPAMIEPTHLSGIIAKKIIQSNRFAKNYVKILNKLNEHTVAAQRVADLKTISRISNEIELNKWLLSKESERLATTGLPSPETVSPTNLGTPRNPIKLGGKIGEEVVMTGRRRNTVGQTDAPEIGDDTKLGKVVAVTHTGGGFPRYSVKIEGYRDFMPVEKIEGGIYEGTKESKATTKAAEVMPREEAPTERAPTDELAELGEKRKYYAQAMIEELGFDKIEDIEDVEIRNEIARILRMKDADKVDEAFAALKEKVDAMEQEKSDKLDAYLEKKAIERETGVITEEPKKTETIPLSPKPMKNASSDLSSDSVPANTTPIGRKTTNVKGSEESATAGGHARPTRGADVEAKIPMKTKTEANATEISPKKTGIGTERNSKYGRQKIVARDDRGNGMYSVKTLETGDIRNYSVSRIDEIIKQNEFEITEEGKAKEISDREARQNEIKQEAEAKQKEVEAWKSFDDWTKGETPMLKARKKSTLGMKMRYNGIVKTRLENVKALVEEGRKFEITEMTGDKAGQKIYKAVNPASEHGEFQELTKTEYEYAKYLDNLEKGTSTGKVAKKEYNTSENLSTKTPKNDGPELQTKQGGTAGSSDEIVKVSLFEEKTGTEPRAKGEDTGSELKGGHIGDTTSAGTGYGAGRPISKNQQGVINKEVIQLLKDKEFSTNPKDYTPEEYEKLKQYEGGGGVTKEEGDFSGANDEFYTPDKIIDDMRYLAKKYGYKDGATVLEPSAGIGRVINRKPMRVDKATGLEIDKTSGTIAKILNPNAEIKIGDYQDNFMDFTKTRALSNAEIEKLPKYDIVIGNPPYKERTTKQRNLGDLGKVNRFEDYFMIRGLDQLKPDGTMVVIVPSTFMDKGPYMAKTLIGERGTLVDAYRLPNKAFPNTDVGTDILVFKKGQRGTADNLGNFQNMNEGKFFKDHPEKVFGEEGTRMGRFGEEKYVKGTMEDVKIQTQTTKELIDERVANASKKIAEQETKGITPKSELVVKDLLTGKEDIIPTPTKVIGMKSKDIATQAEDLKTTGQETIVKPTEIKIDGKPAKLETTKVPEYKPAQQGLFDVPTKAEDAKIADEIVSPKEAVVNKKTVPMKKKGEAKIEVEPITETETRVFNHENIHPSILKETLDYQEKTNVFGEVEGVHYTKNPQLLNYMDGKTFLNYEYFSGDIFQKLDQLEIDKPMITESQYQKQRQGLMDRLPEQQVIENVNFSAIENPQLLNMDTGELQTKYEYVYDPQTKRGQNVEKSVPLTIKEKFKAALKEDLLPSRSRVSANEIIGYIEGRKVDKDRAAMIKEDTEHYFNKFIKEGLTADLQQKIIDGHNRRNRSVVAIDTTQIPLVIKDMSKTFRGKELKLKDVQVQGILKATNKGAYIIAHGVGYGKTMEGVIATEMLIQNGTAKRPVIVVPGQTMQGRKETIKGLFPNREVIDLGTMDAKQRGILEKTLGTDKSKRIKDGTITLMTHSAFENQIAFKKATQDKIGGEFLDDMATDDMTAKQMEALSEKNEATVGAVATTKAKTGADFSMFDGELLREQYGKLETLGHDEFIKSFEETFKETKDKALLKSKAEEMFAMKPIYMEDLGFDALTVDEIHNFKNVFSKAKIEEGNKNMYGYVQGSTSKRGMKMAIATNYILANNNGRGVLGLSATPFNNQAIEVYNILNFVARNRLKKLGITNMNEFMSMFSDFQEQLVVKPSGTDVSYKSIQKNFKNLQDLQRLVNEFIDYKGDSPEIIKPQLKNISVKLQMSELQKRVQMEIEDRIDANAEKGDVIGGQQEARANVVSPYFTNRAGEMPTAADFMRNSPKIDFFADMLIEKRKLGNTDGAILFMPQGVPFHELTREGIALKTGIPIEKIGIINGTAKYKPKMVETARKFNAGELEVLIGGDNINEGIDLQHKTVLMYDTLLGWNPTVTTQKTGRAWRQGNMRNMVAMVTPLMENSVDSVMMQKMEEKQSRINDIFSAEGEVFSVEDIDPAEEKLALMTDPTKKAKIAINIEAKKLQRTAEGLKGDISELERHKANLEAEMNTIPNMLRTIDEYKARNTNGAYDEFIKRYEKDIASLQGKADRSRERIKKNNINIEADLVLNRAELEKVEKEIKELSDTMPARIKEYTEQQQAEIANRKDRRHYLDQVNDVVKNVKVFKDVEEQAAYVKGVPHKK